MLALIAMVIGSVGVDRITKSIAQENLMTWSSPTSLKEYLGRSIPVFAVGELSSVKDPKFYLEFNFTYVRNQGAAWGLFSDLDDSIRIPFFYIVTSLAFLVIFLYLRSTPPSHSLIRFALMLILSGALGNFSDRLIHGYVIDFLDFNWVVPLPFHLNVNIDFFPQFMNFLNLHVDARAWSYDFPKFNWADSMITVGVFCLILDALFLESGRQKKVAFQKFAEDAQQKVF